MKCWAELGFHAAIIRLALIARRIEHLTTSCSMLRYFGHLQANTPAIYQFSLAAIGFKPKAGVGYVTLFLAGAGKCEEAS